jgi:hypothetical protein
VGSNRKLIAASLIAGLAGMVSFYFTVSANDEKMMDFALFVPLLACSGAIAGTVLQRFGVLGPRRPRE